MSLSFPFARFPNFRTNSFYRNSLHNHNISKEKNKTTKAPFPTDNGTSKNHTENGTLEDREFLDVFGIRLYYDDILLISLIFFLYNEGVDDTGLFIALILLLLS